MGYRILVKVSKTFWHCIHSKWRQTATSMLHNSIDWQRSVGYVKCMQVWSSLSNHHVMEIDRWIDRYSIIILFKLHFSYVGLWHVFWGADWLTTDRQVERSSLLKEAMTKAQAVHRWRMMDQQISTKLPTSVRNTLCLLNLSFSYTVLNCSVTVQPMHHVTVACKNVKYTFSE